MTFEREDFRKQLAERRKSNVESLRPRLQREVQAAVAAEKLTGSAEWDYFLSLLQQRREEYQKLADAAREVLLHHEVVGHEDLLRAKIAFERAHSVVSALDWAIEQPKAVLERGDTARKVLSEE